MTLFCTIQTSITLAQYLIDEQLSEIRHEYLSGQVYAMVGAGRAHALIAGNLFAELRSKAPGTDCRLFISDMKVHLSIQTSTP